MASPTPLTAIPPTPSAEPLATVLGFPADSVTAWATIVLAIATVIFTIAAILQLRAIATQIEDARTADQASRTAAAENLVRQQQEDAAARKEAAAQIDLQNELLKLQNKQRAEAHEIFVAGNTLRACERYVGDVVVSAATKRIWEASESGKNYIKSKINDHDVITVLNYLDGIAVGVKQGVFSEEIVKDHMKSTFEKVVDTIIPALLDDTSGYEALIELRGSWRNPVNTSYKMNSNTTSPHLHTQP